MPGGNNLQWIIVVYCAGKELHYVALVRNGFEPGSGDSVQALQYAQNQRMSFRQAAVSRHTLAVRCDPAAAFDVAAISFRCDPMEKPTPGVITALDLPWEAIKRIGRASFEHRAVRQGDTDTFAGGAQLRVPVVPLTWSSRRGWPGRITRAAVGGKSGPSTGPRGVFRKRPEFPTEFWWRRGN